MRPFKHVARTSSTGEPVRYQTILGIDLARFQAPWGEVPILAITEFERITLYYWNARAERWDAFESVHVPLTVEETTPDAPTAWNWSDRVAVACSRDTVHVVYKRGTRDGNELITALIHERYRAPLNGDIRLERLEPGNIAINSEDLQIGRSLWATCDGRGSLIVLYQSRPRNEDWSLTILRRTVDLNTGTVDEQRAIVGTGGFDLDARLDGDRLVVVYRRTPEAFRIPFLMTIGGREVSSGEDADPFYEPLRVATVDLATLTTTEITLPGGQHPQLHRTEPLLVTFDRPSRLLITLETPVIPLPPARPAVSWQQGAMHKIAVLRRGAATFRGTLMASDSTCIPHSHVRISEATLLFGDEGGLLTHAAPFRNFPVYALSVGLEDRNLTLDLLHHRDHLALYRTRLRARLQQGAIIVDERSFEVWDIGHAQIEDPDAPEPSADAENDQFRPIRPRPISAAPRVSVARVNDDNTMGGHLVADLTREPVGFFAYTDLGDGGLRVIYAPDITPLPEPPPIENEKELAPEQVTGPPIPCDIWVELTADDWTDAELPGYAVGLITQRRALGSAMEVPIEFLLDTASIVSGSGNTSDGLPIVPSDGMSKTQFKDIDTFRADLGPPQNLQLTITNGETATVTIIPGVLIAGLDYTVTAIVGGQNPQASWTVLLLDVAGTVPDGPLLPGDIPQSPVQPLVIPGNPVTLRPPREGNYRLSVFFPTGADGRPPGASVNLSVVASVYDLLLPVYDGIADGEMYRIGDLDCSLLQYDMRFGVSAIGEDPSNISIVSRNRAMEVLFKGGETEQGTIESRQLITFSSDDMRLESGLDLVFRVESFTVSLRYGRPFTPGMVLREQRARDILDGRRLQQNASDLIRRNDPGEHAAITAKPYGDASISAHSVDIQIAMAPGGFVVSAVISALLLLGATAVVTVIIGLNAAVLIALAAGPFGAAAAVIALIALTVYIAIEAPKVAERYAEAQVEAMFESGTLLNKLNRQPIVRYSGEGTAEAIARKALVKAAQMELAVPSPGTNEFIGFDRMRGQLFQMIFVTDGICRVLMRIDDCVPQQPGVDTPDLPDGDDDDGDGIVVGTGGGS